jgi:hypothetical protein
MMAVEIHAEGDALSAGAPRALFKTNPMLANHRGSTLDHPFDVSADGRRFLINERLSGASPNVPITVVLNWPAALTR